MTSPTSVTFDWRGASPLLRYGRTSPYARTAVARPPNIQPFSSAGPFWEAHLEGLEPGRTYHYSIDGGPDHTFHGMPVADSRFTVYVEGDVGSSLNYPNVTPVQSLIADGTPSFILVVGDLTYAIDHGQAAVDQHFNDVMAWSQDAAYMPIWGNHDWAPDGPADSVDDLRNYKGRFDLPNGRSSPGAPLVSCCGEDWYWFDAGNTRFIAYPEPYPGAWATWFDGAEQLMAQAQANGAIRFIVTFGHRPAYSSGFHPGLGQLRGMLDSLGTRYGKYVLDLCGHSHDYERSYAMSGVTHVTVGTGGSTLETSTGVCVWAGGCPAPAWSAYRAYHHGALRLDFGPHGIHGEAICGPAARQNDIACGLGETFDAFDLGGDSPPQLRGVPGNLSAQVGQPLAISFVVSDPNDDAIDAVDADLSSLPPGGDARFVPGPGNISGRFTWTPTARDVGDHPITFRASNALTGMATTVIDVQAVLAAPPAAAPVLALDAVRPNPAGAALALSYAVADGAAARLDLLDVAGRVVQHLDRAPLEPGRHVLAWSKPASLPAGMYWLRLRQAGRSVTRSVVFRP